MQLKKKILSKKIKYKMQTKTMGFSILKEFLKILASILQIDDFS